MNGISHTFRNGDLEVFIDGFSRALNNPGKNRSARMFHQIVRIVFDIRLALDLGLKGNDDEPSPSAVIIRPNFGEMVRIKDKCLRRLFRPAYVSGMAARYHHRLGGGWRHGSFDRLFEAPLQYP
jgi:hypothetical protein